jgi:hypothetical protein
MVVMFSFVVGLFVMEAFLPDTDLSEGVERRDGRNDSKVTRQLQP